MISCHWRIMPSFLLSKSAILTGMRSWTSVISSWNVIWKPPSPVIAQVSRSGRPRAAPMAAGTEKPIVPRPRHDVVGRQEPVAPRPGAMPRGRFGLAPPLGELVEVVLARLDRCLGDHPG